MSEFLTLSLVLLGVAVPLLIFGGSTERFITIVVMFFSWPFWVMAAVTIVGVQEQSCRRGHPHRRDNASVVRSHPAAALTGPGLAYSPQPLARAKAG